MSPRSPRSVAFIGVGAMGEPMVRRLAAAGFHVLAHDQDAGRLGRIASEPGVEAASELSELRDVEAAITMLPDSNVVDSVVGGRGGLLEVLSAGALVIDMGSSEPRRTVALAKAAGAAGIELVDAPVSGGVVRARTGDLSIMFGGSAAQLERARPLLEPLGSSITAVGPVGAGHAMKALNNLLSAVGLAAAGEVLEVGRRFGLEPETMLEVLNHSTGRNHATENKIAQFVLNESFASGFALRLMVKDITIATELARAEEVAIPLSSACVEVWRRAAEIFPADADHTRVATLPALVSQVVR